MTDFSVDDAKITVRLLQKKSSVVLLLYPLIGVLMGGALGLFYESILFSPNEYGDFSRPLIGGILGAVAGYVVGVQLGQERALMMKAQKSILEALIQGKE